MKLKTFFILGISSIIIAIGCSHVDADNVYSARIIGPYKTNDVIMASITEAPLNTAIPTGSIIAFAASDLPSQKFDEGAIISFRIMEFHEGGIQTTEHIHINYFCLVKPI